MEVYVILKLDGKSMVRRGRLLSDSGNQKKKKVMIDGEIVTVKNDQVLRSKLVADGIAEFY